ncbi:MAG TPA: glycosyltransferase family 4 protein [Ilumatobacteraceae bacterium]|nr:glycosyltransferase family 4 protein [Ilumatobacteraceae bacterium]
MRVVHVITEGEIGGAQTHVADLARWQQRHGDEVAVVTGTDGQMCRLLRDADIEVEVSSSLVRSVNPLRDLSALGQMVGTLRRLRPDVIHAHSSKAGVLARSAARRLKVPAVYTAHGWPFQPQAGWKQRVISRLGETAMGHWWGDVICLTPAEIDLARRLRVVPEQRLHLVPLGIPDSGHSAPQGNADGPVKLIMVARFSPPKDQRGVIEALALLGADHWRMSFVGDGPGRADCQALASSLGIDQRIDFLGERDDVAALLADHDIAVLWSDYEGMPLAVIEALRAGRPIVSSDLPGARAIIGDSVAGLLANTCAALAKALDGLIADTSRQRQMGAAGRARFEDQFVIDVMAERLAGVYRAAAR